MADFDCLIEKANTMSVPPKLCPERQSEAHALPDGTMCPCIHLVLMNGVFYVD